MTQTYGLTDICRSSPLPAAASMEEDVAPSASCCCCARPRPKLLLLRSGVVALLPNELRIQPLPPDGEAEDVVGRARDGATPAAAEAEGGLKPATWRCREAPRPEGRGIGISEGRGVSGWSRGSGAVDAELSQGSTGRVGVSGTANAEPNGSPTSTFVGEILVRGPSITGGYLPDDGNLEAPLPATDAEGWLHTGDMGYLDGEGYLYVVDRRVDLIVSGGENVYPAEIEAVLHAHPAIDEAAIYGVADDEWGQRVEAAIVVRPGVRIGKQEIMAFCRERLAPYKVPSKIRVVDALPRNAAGKLLRRTLRDGRHDTAC